MKNFIGSRVLPDMVYHRPERMGDAKSLLSELQQVKVIAGCTDFIPAIRRGAWTFEDGLNILAIKNVKELCGIAEHGNTVTIGAATTLSDIENSPLIREHAPILADTMREMASWQIRNTATIGGNLCTASPAADTAPPLLVLDAKVTVSGPNKEKTVPLNAFFLGPGQTILHSNEMLTGIQFPAAKANERTFRIKMGRRNAFTLSVISLAVWLRIEDGAFENVRIAFGAVAPTPIRAQRAEEFLRGKKANPEIIDKGAEIAAGEVSPISDVRASAEYRKDMAYVLSKRALTACAT
jgi:carbon-monoxide dehydrogenase medium subunit